ncbi:hypothetical protein RRG08_025835 [Elysia crispata]|uniref:Uncharacterized protein n=1 Tax=Elysia crispata TaxID=231223 RepID=A0AAE1CRW0_9GAST|nr:hypothetical protein RRG08_025835 [Elysia crispata]
MTSPETIVLDQSGNEASLTSKKSYEELPKVSASQDTKCGHMARTSDMMKLYLGVVRTSMLYRWTWSPHLRHDETLPGCCAHIHAVQVDMEPARQT